MYLSGTMPEARMFQPASKTIVIVIVIIVIAKEFLERNDAQSTETLTHVFTQLRLVHAQSISALQLLQDTFDLWLRISRRTQPDECFVTPTQQEFIHLSVQKLLNGQAMT